MSVMEVTEIMEILPHRYPFQAAGSFFTTAQLRRLEQLGGSRWILPGRTETDRRIKPAHAAEEAFFHGRETMDLTAS